MPRDDGSLRAVIDLDKKSGKFELDERGYTKFIPSDEKRVQLNRWMASEIERAKRNMLPLFEAAAENIETYKPARLQIKDQSGRAVLPSPIARTPADQKIANTVNNVMRPRPIVSFDPYFNAKYPVLVPVSVQVLMEEGVPIDPSTDPNGEVAVQSEVDAETLSRRFEQGVEFHFRERMAFGEHLHRVVHNCIVGAPPYWKVCWKQSPRTTIKPSKAGAFYDTSTPDEEYGKRGDVHWYIVDFRNVLRPNLDDKVNDLPWIAERSPDCCPDDVTTKYEAGEYFLIPDDDAAGSFAACTVAVSQVDDTKRRTDATTRNYDPQDNPNECEIYEVQFYANLKVAPPEGTPKGAPAEARRFSLIGDYHVGKGEFMSIYRNYYDHQKRTLVPFMEYLDGSSTVEILKPAQQLQTHLVQAEVKNAYHANNVLYSYNPQSYEIASFIGNNNQPLAPGTWVPGMEGVDWKPVRGGFEHYSLLPLMQWNAGTSQEASRISDYEAGNRVVSHTSPYTVQQMLDRGGQGQVLFLRLLDRGVRDVVRLTLETMRQFKPLGEEIPVRDPKTKQLIMVPMRYPIGDVLDNFRISLTAADEAIARERDAEQMGLMLDMYQRHTTFVAQVVAPMLSDQATPEMLAFYRKVIEGEQALYDRIIGPIRTDEEKFDVLGSVDALVQERQVAIEQAKQQQMMEMMNAQQGQPPAAGGIATEAGGGEAVAPAGAGAEPGMAGGETNPPAQSPYGAF